MLMTPDAMERMERSVFFVANWQGLWHKRVPAWEFFKRVAPSMRGWQGVDECYARQGETLFCPRDVYHIMMSLSEETATCSEKVRTPSAAKEKGREGAVFGFVDGWGYIFASKAQLSLFRLSILAHHTLLLLLIVSNPVQVLKSDNLYLNIHELTAHSLLSSNLLMTSIAMGRCTSLLSSGDSDEGLFARSCLFPGVWSYGGCCLASVARGLRGRRDGSRRAR